MGGYYVVVTQRHIVKNTISSSILFPSSFLTTHCSPQHPQGILLCVGGGGGGLEWCQERCF